MSEDDTDPVARAEACLRFLNGKPSDYRLHQFWEYLTKLPVEEQHYWVGTLYTLMLSPNIRRSQATYFTPPVVAGAVIDFVVDAGFDIARHNVMDPAAGGAAFLSTLAGRMKRAKIDVDSVARRLFGIEIDIGLAHLSRRLIEEQLGTKLDPKNIFRADSLQLPVQRQFDLVIANPPYGRVTAEDVRGDDWMRVAHPGHINKYALFSELSFRLAKPGGLIALVIPSSFRAGPLYDRMREFVRKQGQILSIASIYGRNGVFLDVQQDVSVLVARRGSPHQASRLVDFPIIGQDVNGLPPVKVKLPKDKAAAWPLPATDPELVGGAKLADYGVQAKVGYFVWNRETSRMRKRVSSKLTYPLIWAKNVRSGRLCYPAGRTKPSIDFVKFQQPSSAIVSGPSAVMQRTTNDGQPRRLIAAVVDPKVVAKWGGFVTENHTIVLTADDPKKLDLAIALLNTSAVDKRYRQVSGTASVSVSLLRELDLPRPKMFARALKAHNGNAEIAAAIAYGDASEPGAQP
ncbi:HsdM family class I SAM-dependent methyltransferase [Kordiimonas lacus]|uniref:HsdM family class I SAM-dependent methyltransferase n=1 Tax=Kordiimonas lacus TaxID=637679 RepID=UPI0019D387FF|nr:N-6 DNA methylase [Kordiimonas lacus]